MDDKEQLWELYKDAKAWRELRCRQIENGKLTLKHLEEEKEKAEKRCYELKEMLAGWTPNPFIESLANRVVLENADILKEATKDGKNP